MYVRLSLSIHILLVAVCMIVCLGIYFLSAYFFVTFLGEPSCRESRLFSS
jgi:hypothetical protein